MKTISGYILVNILGWKIIGDFPDIKKSIVICAPHTSYFDAFYGKLYLNEKGIKYTIKKGTFLFSYESCYENYRFNSSNP